MSAFAARYDQWRVIMTAAPIVLGALGALLIRRRPETLGRVVLVYAVLCILIALSPLLVARLAGPGAELRPLLEETKFAFVIGLAALLAAGGRPLKTGASARTAR